MNWKNFYSRNYAPAPTPAANEVIRDALDLLRQRDLRLADLKKEVAIGIAQADRGETAPWDADEIKAEGRKLLAARRKPA